ncbi:NAD-dependent DNA ligase LigA [Pseudoramibacter faecis]|uniref:NAD-dependent DNA ligase LigA n=1 Tax=Pseudoramibacter faecis TaxID=3108534 RepID=UPI002E79C466|nr:NAD-dependent DNA ligase LigA [Pseudoramibacter sp. HA2172]
MAELTINQQMADLIEKINAASEAYYGGREELMSNYEWDALFDALIRLEKEAGYARSDSPTQRVSASSSEASGEKVAHEYPMLSLAKTKTVADLVKWADGRDVWLSLKLDGLTLVATYDEGRLSRLVTRGNGNVGTDITHLAPAIDGVPIQISEPGHLVIRGEALITYKDFESFLLESEETYANPRNLASGSLSLKDIDEVRRRHLQWIPFTLVHLDHEMISWGARMDYLASLGFHPVARERLQADTLSDGIARWSEQISKGAIPYPVDGLVMTYDDTDYARTGSVTGHHATRAGLAFKWQDTSVDSILTEIDWSCAASTITPVAIFEPVALEGTIVKRASLHNISECRRLGIGGAGTRVTVIKANKIIPKVIAAEGEGNFVIPETCPVCSAPTTVAVSSSGAETLHCSNPECAAKHLQKFNRFVSRYGMDIDGLSIQTMNKFINQGFIKSFSDIYQLSKHFDTIREMDGFGEKSVTNLAAAIEKSRRVKPENLLFALCIPMIGVDAGKRLTNAIGLEGVLNRLNANEGFDDIEGIGPERSDSLLTWYADEKNAADLTQLLAELQVDMGAKQSNRGRCEGLTFVITGKVRHYQNRDAFKAYVESQGGHVSGSVSKKTDYLVNNDVESTSAKNRRARDLGVSIISEAEFVERFA